MLSGNTVKGEIAYGVVAGVMWVVWMAVAVWFELRSNNIIASKGRMATDRKDGSLDNGVEKAGSDVAA